MKAALNAEADITREVGTFAELLVSGKFPVVKDKLLFDPYVAAGISSGFSTGDQTGLNSREIRFGANLPVTLSVHWKLNFQIESVFSTQLHGVVRAGGRVTYKL